MILKLPKTVPPAARVILEDGEELGRRMREAKSQLDVARGLGVSSDTVKIARDYHGIPTRPFTILIPANLEGMAPRDVLSDPALTQVLMDRVYSRIGRCPAYCYYWNTKTCPWPVEDLNGDRDDDDDEDRALGEMHPLCPLRFYRGSDRDGDAPLYRRISVAASRPTRKDEKEEVETEPEREPDTPASFLEFLTQIQIKGE